MFYLQVKDAILSDEIYCPPETTVLIASYACQAKFGDYNNDIHEPGFLSNDRTLPDRSISFSLYLHCKKKTQIGFQDQLSLNAGQKYCRMLQGKHSAILQPSLSYHLSLRSLFCLFLSGRFTQVLL